MNVESYYEKEYWKERLGHGDVDYKAALFFELIRENNIVIPSECYIIEIGCGTGVFIRPLSKLLNSMQIKYKIKGYDIAVNAIEFAQKINTNPNVEYLLGSADQITEKVDFIFLLDVIEHLCDPYNFVKRLYGKSSFLIINVPIEQSIAHILVDRPETSYRLFRHIGLHPCG